MTLYVRVIDWSAFTAESGSASLDFALDGCLAVYLPVGGELEAGYGEVIVQLRLDERGIIVAYFAGRFQPEVDVLSACNLLERVGGKYGIGDVVAGHHEVCTQIVVCRHGGVLDMAGPDLRGCV